MSLLNLHVSKTLDQQLVSIPGELKHPDVDSRHVEEEEDDNNKTNNPGQLNIHLVSSPEWWPVCIVFNMNLDTDL